MSTTNPHDRDQSTGEVANKVAIHVHVEGEPLPRTFLAQNWTKARGFLGSAEFRGIAERVNFVTLTNRDR